MSKTADSLTMQAYDAAQALMLEGKLDRGEIEVKLVKRFPDVNAQGLIPTIVRRAARDLYEL